MSEVKVLYASPEAASQQTLTGWVSRTGRFWGSDEHMARYDGCTHMPCKTCAAEIENNRVYCNACERQRAQAKYAAMPESDWNGSDMLHLHDTDIWFQDAEGVHEYCHDHDLKVVEMRLVIGEPAYAEEIDANEHFADNLPEDGEVPSEIVAAIAVLNAVIRKNGTPLCWWPGDTKVSAKSKAAMISATQQVAA